MSEKVKFDDGQISNRSAESENSSWDRRSERRMERAERREERRDSYRAASYGWFGGFVLIAIGAIFMLQNMDILRPIANWWALFLFLPAAGIFASALDLHRRNNQHWTLLWIGPFMGALFLVFMAITFLFGLDFGLFFPLFLIGAGIVLLGGVMLSRTRPVGEGK
jgi:hypothetical protein